MVVTSNHVVVRWGCTRQTKIVLIYHSACHSKSLSSNLCRIEARVQAKFTTRTSWLLLHALIDLLLGINAELIVIVLVAYEVSASTLWGDALSWGGLARSFTATFFNTTLVVVLPHRHCRLHHLLLTRCTLAAVCVISPLGDHNVRILDDKIVAWPHIELKCLRGSLDTHHSCRSPLLILLTLVPIVNTGIRRS